jgi:hypothetical protein
MEKKTTSDPFFNLADALAEDILATEEQELLREAAQDHSDPFALSKKFDEIVGRVSEKKDGVIAFHAAPPSGRSQRRG